MKVAIIGGGLAGCALGYVLRQSGCEPVIYEAGENIANGASGNSVGLYNPRFTAERTPQSEYYTAGFALALRVFAALSAGEQDIEWNPSGALHLINDEKKGKRFGKTAQNWGWSMDELRVVSHDEASEIAGVPITHDALYLAKSGSVCPKTLCAAYAAGVEVRTGAAVESLDDIDADITILACGPAVKNFASDLPIGSVRGQITEVKSTPQSEALKCAVCYGGYISPALNGQHIVGSTFQRWLDHSEIIDQDDEDNLTKLAENLPGMEQGMEVVGRRASVRATSKDHFPIVGEITDGVYVSAAHGSHGILSSLMAAHVLADMILDQPKSLPMETVAALSPVRFS